MPSVLKLDFKQLDPNRTEYHRWVTDIETTFIGNELLPCIRPHNPDLVIQPTPAKMARALMYLRRHMAQLLQWEYMQIKCPKELWQALEERFGNIQDTLLPDLSVKWNDIRFQDFKTVNEFNSEMLRLRAMLQFCGKNLTEADLIEKTLSNFPASSLILQKQYRLEFQQNRLTTFNQLINLLQVAEKHDNIMMNNCARPPGTKRVPEANYGKAQQRHNERNPNIRENSNGRAGPYIRSNRDENRNNVAMARGDNTPRGRGQGGRGKGRGGHSKVWHRNQGVDGPNGYNNRVQNAPRNPPKAQGAKAQGVNRVKGAGIGNELCYRCGSTEHWFRLCKACNKLAADYRRYRDSKEQEAYYGAEDGDGTNVNLTIVDFEVNNDQEKTMEAPDFD